MFTVDASVWVNADSPAEPHQPDSRALLDLLFAHENQTEEEAVAEAEAAFNDPRQTVVLVPTALLPKVHKLLSSHSTGRRASA